MYQLNLSQALKLKISMINVKIINFELFERHSDFSSLSSAHKHFHLQRRQTRAPDAAAVGAASSEEQARSRRSIRWVSSIAWVGLRCKLDWGERIGEVESWGCPSDVSVCCVCKVVQKNLS